jgi:DnaJ-class molecular chaperone
VKIIAALLAEAVETCATCDGNGFLSKPSGYPSQVRCPKCGAKGRVLTTEGHKLVEFVTLWLGPKFADRDHGHSLH